MYNIAFDKELLNIAEDFFKVTGVNDLATACELNHEHPLAVLYGSDRMVADFLSDVPQELIILANSDEFPLMRLLGGVNCTVISCGLSSRDTITASSMENAHRGMSLELCVQREIVALNGMSIEPQELRVSLRGMDIDINKAILISASLLICGFSHEIFKEKIVL